MAENAQGDIPRQNDELTSLAAGSVPSTRLMRVTIGGTERQWWAALHEARAAGTMPAALVPIADGTDGEIALSYADWLSVRAWGQSLPGWRESDGAEQLLAEELE